jgi:broad specificity phosphatase PhoE
MRKAVYLIRHGESSFNRISNATERDPFHYDASLTKLGVRQADGVEGESDLKWLFPYIRPPTSL